MPAPLPSWFSPFTHTSTYTPFKRFYYTAKKNNNNSKRKKNIDRTSLVDKLD
jgi:hypothetical protein